MSTIPYTPQESYSHQLRQNLSKASGVAFAVPSQKRQTFISKVQRFASSSTIVTPGPGAYDQTVTEKHTIDFRINKNKETTVNPQHAWINDSHRLSFVPSKASINPLGPGEYQDNISHASQHSHSNWAKGERFQQLTGFKNKLGPGEYNTKLQLRQIIAPVSVFRSKSPRTYIEQMMDKKIKELKDRQNPQEQKKPDQVVKFEENEYLVKRKVDKFDKLSPVFMSKAERPKLENQNTSYIPGPGTYSSQKVMYKPLQTKAPRSSIHYTSQLDALRGRSSQLGPGSYNYDRLLGSQKFGRREPLCYISKSQRFKKPHSQKKPALSPGPGQYNQKRFTMINEDDLRLKNKGSFIRKAQKNHNFGQAPRITLRNNNNNPFGQYNLKNYDISHRLEKQKLQYEKLKMMQVTLPAFNTKQHH